MGVDGDRVKDNYEAFDKWNDGVLDSVVVVVKDDVLILPELSPAKPGHAAYTTLPGKQWGVYHLGVSIVPSLAKSRDRKLQTLVRPFSKFRSRSGYSQGFQVTLA